jgi:hypothetical protein
MMAMMMMIRYARAQYRRSGYFKFGTYAAFWTWSVLRTGYCYARMV